MTSSAEFAGLHESIDSIARQMRDSDIGAVPVCGDDSRSSGY